MRIVLNAINGEYLRSIIQLADTTTERVDCAVAYATGAELLFDWCWSRNVPLRYWGRFDDGIPVSVPILKSFLERRSPNFQCKLVRHFHAKVIWWRGYGAYIGSANLTGAAWYNNIEAGIFITDEDLAAAGQDLELEQFFESVNRYASPLTEELLRVIEQRSLTIQSQEAKDRAQAQAFQDTALVQPWGGLVHVSNARALANRKSSFLNEWNSTLQILRDIGHRVSQTDNRPKWVARDTPSGAQADQFLHAHYYERTFDGTRAIYEERYEENKQNPDRALREAMKWWSTLEAPPGSEGEMLSESSPKLRQLLARSQLEDLDEAELCEICMRVHAMRDHARRMSNTELGLDPTSNHSEEDKATALAAYLWSRRSTGGLSTPQLLSWVLYGGPRGELSDRLWDAVSDPSRRIPHLGVSAIGELVGWALPDDFPPRNGRTSKALRSLGYDVAVHV